MENINTIDDSLIPLTPLKWFAWLSSEEQKTRQSYLAKPSNLLADYRSEKAITRDYEGREILELLQNSADQARESDVHGRVVIELLPEGLIVANTGAAFSVGGVQSLQTAHLSPKWRKKRPLIGNKGLGFRSILNWSHSPIILSGALALSYSLTFARKVLSELIEASPELARRIEIEDERRSSDEIIVPLLSFPGYNKTGEIDLLVENGPAKEILAKCQAFRREGYDTVIGMVFDNPGAHQEAQEQIHELRPEILLFVDHLTELRFLEAEADERIWTFEGDDDLSMVLENNVPLGMWQIHRTSGIIPESYLDNDQKYDQDGKLGYEIVIAVPDVKDATELKSATLFSHFPTSIELPLPVISHATLELNQSRNHTLQRRSNKFVFDRLASFLAEIAERRARQFPTGPNAGFRLLLPLKSYPNDLTRENFPEQVIAAAKERAIVPTLRGEAVCPAQARFIDATSTSWLPKDAFPEVVVFCDAEEQKFFKELSVPILKPPDLKQRLMGLNSLSISHRAALIAGLLEHPVDKAVYTSALLLDTAGKQVPEDTPVFLAPIRAARITLPEWTDVRFLHDGLRSELEQRLKTHDVRALQGKLAAFGLLEYSLANLIRRIVVSANRRKNDYPDEAASVDHDVRVTIFSLYKSEPSSERHPEYPKYAPLPLPNQGGGASPATTLYFGKGYGSQGNITQNLFGPWAPEKLVVGPEMLNLSDDREELVSFLKWVHVAAWPREVFIDDPRDGYLEYVLSKLRYPVNFDEYVFAAKKDIERPRLNQIHSIDGLVEILQNADPIAIVAWMALDPRVHQWTRPSKTHARLSARRGQAHYDRYYDDTLPGYFRWKTENTPWLEIQSGEKTRPKDCAFAQRAIEAVFPKPLRPTPEVMERFGIVANDLMEGWRRSGVLMSLAELELEDVYSRLIDLPQKDPQGRSARRLYQWLLEASDSAMGNGESARAVFIKNGKMWGIHGEVTAYYPVSELYYVDSEGLPTGLIQRLKIVDLPYRIGTDKVKRVFGVRSIDRYEIEQHVANFTLAADFNEEFQKAKPYLYRLRTSQSSQAQHLNGLKRLSLKVCSELTAVIRYEEYEFDFVPPVWGWLIDQDVLFVRSDPAEPVDITSDLLADSIGEAIASLFRIGDGGEFARMFLCRSKDRRTLLRRMRGEAADEDMEKIITELGVPDPVSQFATLPADIAITDPASKASSPSSNDQPQKEPEKQNKQANVADPSALAGPLKIESKGHQPMGLSRRSSLKINKITGGYHKVSGMYRVTDGDFCERKAMEFEERDEQQRYPLRVGQITGNAAFGCDILSFASHENRENFRLGVCRDLSKVLRFIEVKGRKSDGGSIEIKGNQRTAAITHKERYYIYRLYRSGADEYQLSVLQGPLQQKCIGSA